MRHLVRAGSLGVALVQSLLAQANGFADRIGAITSAAEFKAAHWGLLIADAKTGETVLEQAADKLFAPASTTKLFTVAAALKSLGPDHRFTTRLVRRGEVSGQGVLNGDLVLLASGDPTLGGRTDADGRIAFTSSDHIYSNGNERGAMTEPDPLAGLDALARGVAKAGIRRIEGDVLIDARLFEAEASTGSGPRRVLPIIVNDNLIDLVITPGKRGEPATVDWRPKCACLQVDAKVVTSEPEAKTKIEVRMPTPGRVVVRGALAERHAPLLRVQEIDDPVAFARALLIEALARAGVSSSASVFDPVREGALPARDAVAGLPEVASLVSPPFTENAKLILKVSHNLHASLLPLLLAARAGKRTLRAGLEEQGKVLAGLGVEPGSVAFGGGAGGAGVDRAAPRATVALLRAIDREPWGPDFAAMLPGLGVDGTLKLAVAATSPALGKVSAKTGTYYLDDPLNGNTLLTSKALAGYLQAKSGRRFAFCFVVNGVHLPSEDDADRIGRVLGKLCEVAWEEL